jgi:hypothetical protein
MYVVPMSLLQHACLCSIMELTLASIYLSFHGSGRCIYKYEQKFVSMIQACFIVKAMKPGPVSIFSFKIAVFIYLNEDGK